MGGCSSKDVASSAKRPRREEDSTNFDGIMGPPPVRGNATSGSNTTTSPADEKDLSRESRSLEMEIVADRTDSFASDATDSRKLAASSNSMKRKRFQPKFTYSMEERQASLREFKQKNSSSDFSVDLDEVVEEDGKELNQKSQQPEISPRPVIENRPSVRAKFGPKYTFKPEEISETLIVERESVHRTDSNDPTTASDELTKPDVIPNKDKTKSKTREEEEEVELVEDLEDFGEDVKQVGEEDEAISKPSTTAGTQGKFTSQGGKIDLDELGVQLISPEGYDSDHSSSEEAGSSESELEDWLEAEENEEEVEVEEDYSLQEESEDEQLTPYLEV